MTKQTFRHILVILACAVLALAAFAAAGTAETISEVTFKDRSWDGTKVKETLRVENNLPAFPNSRTLDPGWYVVDRNITINDRVILTGNTQIVLLNDCTLDVRGLYIPQGFTLTIYGQGNETGKIKSHPSSGAGIGAYAGHKGGNVVIVSGTVEATGYDHCAGIGSNDGDEKDVGSFTMYGGTVTATGGTSGAGVGGGRASEGGKITIYGGTLTATGKHYGAGIGGGNGQDTNPMRGAHGGTITIWGGKVTARGGDDGAGIGGGEGGNAGTITINGGTVTATGGDNSAGIGGGESESTGTGGTITISGGTVTATGGNDGAGIGGGENGWCDSITILGGTITAKAGRQAAAIGGGNNADSGDIRILGGSFTIDESKSDSKGIGSGHDSEGATKITIGYTAASTDTTSIKAESYNGTVTLIQAFKDADTAVPFAAGIYGKGAGLTGRTLQPADPTPVAYKKPDGTTETQACVPVMAGLTSWYAGWYAVTADTTIDNPVEIIGNVSLILVDGFTLNTQNIKVSEGNSLTIWGQAAGSGTLNATSANKMNAGIGGANSDCGTITINGGTVVAHGGAEGVFGSAGIGASVNHKPGKVVINGGTVDAYGGNMGGAGIGGGFIDVYNYRSLANGSGVIEINGGSVTAHGGKGAAGIGSGILANLLSPGSLNGTGTIRITGGTVTAYGNIIKWSDGFSPANIYGTVAAIGGGFCSNAGDITISGGTVYAHDNGGAGIGAGCGYIQGGGRVSGGTITITGGTVYATGARYASAIGSGYMGGGVTIAISGGTIVTNGGVSKNEPFNSSFPKGIGRGFDGDWCGINISWTAESKDTMSLAVSDFSDNPYLENDFVSLSDGGLIQSGNISVDHLRGKTLVPYADGDVIAFTPTVIGEGTVEVRPAGAIHAGDTVTLVTSPAEGYFTKFVTINGKRFFPDEYGEYSFKMPYASPTATVTFASLDTASAWTRLQDEINRASNGAKITLDDNVTAYVDPRWDAEWEDDGLHIPYGMTLTLDLKGHTLDRGLDEYPAADRGYAILNDGMLTITDSVGGGKITGGRNDGDGGGILNRGELTIEGIEISGNKAINSGGGIHNSGKLRIAICETTTRNCVITGNAAIYYHGGGIYNIGELHLDNVTITGNKAEKGQGDGILQNGTISIKGASVIKENKGTYTQGTNLFLRSGHTTITVDGPLADAELYVTSETVPATITSGYATDNAGLTPGDVIHPDNAKLQILPDGSPVEALLTTEQQMEVTFDSDNGTAMDVQSVIAGRTATKPDDPVRSGCVFVDWYELYKVEDEETGAKKEVLADEPFDFTTKIYTDLTLRAAWQSTVTFDGGDDDAENPDDIMKPVTVRAGETYILPACGFTLEGMAFRTWSVQAGSDPAVEKAPGDEITVTADTTVTALWAYTVFFSAGVQDADGFMSHVIVAPGDAYELPDCTFTAEGKTFRAWSVQIGDAGGDEMGPHETITVTENTTVTAIWECRIIFDKGDEAAVGAMPNYRDNAGTEFVLPECLFTAEGKTFKAWSVKIGGAEAFTAKAGSTVTITSDTTVTALWRDAETAIYTVTFDAGDDSATGSMPDAEVLAGSDYLLPDCAFTVEGKTFMYWSVETGGEETQLLAPGDRISAGADAEVAVTAVWGYTVTFDSGTADGTMAPVTVIPGTAYALPTCDFEYGAAGFMNWSVKIGEAEAVRMATDDEITVTANTTVTPVWSYPVVFATGDIDADGDMDTLHLEEGAKYTLPDCGYTLTGATFTAWHTQIGGENPAILPVGGEITITGSTTLTAIWMRPASFILPAGTTKIEASAFEGNTGITTVDARNVTSIGEYAFKDCRYLTEIRLPKDCSIDPNAFYNCGEITVFAPARGSTETFCSSRPAITFIPIP